MAEANVGLMTHTVSTPGDVDRLLTLPSRPSGRMIDVATLPRVAHERREGRAGNIMAKEVRERTDVDRNGRGQGLRGANTARLKT